MINIEALAQPIVSLLSSFGTGVLPTGSPADALRVSSAAIDSVHASNKTAISTLGGAWNSKAADAAMAKATDAQGSAVQISDRGNSIADVVAAASADVNAGMVELEGILQSFIGVVAAAGPAILTPPGQMMLVSAAIEHLGRALAVVSKVRAQLSEHTARISALTPEEHTPQEAGKTAPATAAPQSGTAPAATTQAATAPAGQASGNPVQTLGQNFSSGFGQTSNAGGGIGSMVGSPVSSAMSSGMSSAAGGGKSPSNSLYSGTLSEGSGTSSDPVGHKGSLSSSSNQSFPPGQTGEWIKEAYVVLEDLGYDTSKIDPADVEAIIQHESGGNPNAINNWDSNAAAGIPSKGLMQTIDPTFEAYKAPGYDDIYNPVHNIVAGIRYSIDRYGGVENVPGVQAVKSGSGYVGY